MPALTPKNFALIVFLALFECGTQKSELGGKIGVMKIKEHVGEEIKERGNKDRVAKMGK